MFAARHCGFHERDPVVHGRNQLGREIRMVWRHARSVWRKRGMSFAIRYIHMSPHVCCQWDALMDVAGHINTLGKQYIGAISPNISNGQPGIVHGGSGGSGGPSMSDAFRIHVCCDAFLIAIIIFALVT